MAVNDLMARVADRIVEPGFCCNLSTMIISDTVLKSMVDDFRSYSQTSERSGTIMMVPFPMRVNNQRLPKT